MGHFSSSAPYSPCFLITRICSCNFSLDTRRFFLAISSPLKWKLYHRVNQQFGWSGFYFALFLSLPSRFCSYKSPVYDSTGPIVPFHCPLITLLLIMKVSFLSLFCSLHGSLSKSSPPTLCNALDTFVNEFIGVCRLMSPSPCPLAGCLFLRREWPEISMTRSSPWTQCACCDRVS